MEDTLRIVEDELTTSGEHIGQLNEEIGQLQQKLDDAKAKQKTILLRTKTVSSRVQVKKQVQRDELDNAFAKFERFERKVDNLEGGNCRPWIWGAILPLTWRRKSTRWVKRTGWTRSSCASRTRWQRLSLRQLTMVNPKRHYRSCHTRTQRKRG